MHPDKKETSRTNECLFLLPVTLNPLLSVSKMRLPQPCPYIHFHSLYWRRFFWPQVCWIHWMRLFMLDTRLLRTKSLMLQEGTVHNIWEQRCYLEFKLHTTFCFFIWHRLIPFKYLKSFFSLIISNMGCSCLYPHTEILWFYTLAALVTLRSCFCFVLKQHWSFWNTWHLLVPKLFPLIFL